MRYQPIHRLPYGVVENEYDIWNLSPFKGLIWSAEDAMTQMGDRINVLPPSFFSCCISTTCSLKFCTEILCNRWRVSSKRRIYDNYIFLFWYEESLSMFKKGRISTFCTSDKETEVTLVEHYITFVWNNRRTTRGKMKKTIDLNKWAKAESVSTLSVESKVSPEVYLFCK